MLITGDKDLGRPKYDVVLLITLQLVRLDMFFLIFCGLEKRERATKRATSEVVRVIAIGIV